MKVAFLIDLHVRIHFIQKVSISKHRKHVICYYDNYEQKKSVFINFRLAVVYTSVGAKCHHIHSPYTVASLGTKRRYTGTTVLRLTHLRCGYPKHL